MVESNTSLGRGDLIDTEKLKMSRGQQITIPKRLRDGEDGYVAEKRVCNGIEYFVLIPMMFEPNYPEAVTRGA